MIKNRHIKSCLTLFVVFSMTTFIAISCSDNPADGGDGNKPVQGVKKVEDLNAATGNRGKAGKFTFYSLENNDIVLTKDNSVRSDSATAKWDIAFSGRDIIANGGDKGPGNGGILFLDVPFDNVTKAPTQGYQATIKWEDWANYTGQNEPKHAFLPKEDVTIVVKTADGNHVAKVKILSWYKGAPDPNSSTFADPYSRTPGHFTFQYKFIK